MICLKIIIFLYYFNDIDSVEICLRNGNFLYSFDDSNSVEVCLRNVNFYIPLMTLIQCRYI